MIRTEFRTIAEERLVPVEYVCDYCGRIEKVSEFPNHWVEVTTQEGVSQCCQPACYFKVLSLSPTSMKEGTYERSLVDYVRPLFAKGEMDIPKEEEKKLD